ncbi:hypothetical protein FEM03_21675 [Phragmitibacter flavus]|uniref:Antitoxin n=1 Tax=Phragmitibacter flavus TaxID=2576071 RepID=A0A5R8K8I5_9BACT|nr:hypothetical protein [Phragmitibacter flavus]TLD68652.1 hypothetical protein FEM03_21675 [Phragmitibacter flavus]
MTVTLDPDTMVLLREEMMRSGFSFNEVLNQSFLRSLLAAAPGIARHAVTPNFTAPFPSELSIGDFNRLANELDDDATVSEFGM